MDTRAIILIFNIKMKLQDIRPWRDTVLAAVKHLHDDCFFNHYVDGPKKGKPISRYPPIHYRVYDGHAALYGIGKGKDSLLRALREGCFVKLSAKYDLFTIEEPLEIMETLSYYYRVSHLQPYGTNAYSISKEIEDPSEMYEFLEEKLVRQFRKLMFKDLGLDELKLQVDILIQIAEPFKKKVSKYLLNKKTAKGKGSNLWDTLDVEFVSNVKLPQYIAIGNNVAFGYGVLQRMALE